MIKTEQGHCRMYGSDTTVMVDYIVTTEAMKDMLMGNMEMTETQAKDKLLTVIETAFMDKEELEEKNRFQVTELPEKQRTFERLRKWRKRK